MINEKFLDWIRIEQDKGFDTEKIKEYLVSKKYNPEDIDKAFAELDKQEKKDKKTETKNSSKEKLDKKEDEKIDTKSIDETPLQHLQDIIEPGSNIWAKLCLIFGFLLPPLGIIFGMISIKKIYRHNAPGEGMTHAGVMIGTIFWLMILSMMWWGKTEAAYWIPMLMVGFVLLEWIIFTKFMFNTKEHFFIVIVCVLALLVSLVPIVVFPYGPKTLDISKQTTASLIDKDLRPEILTQYETRFTDRCILTHPEVSCVLVGLQDNHLNFKLLRNNKGSSEWETLSVWVGDYCMPKDVSLKKGEEAMFSCNIPPLSSGQRYKKTLDMKYYDSGKLNSIIGRILVTYR